tara:strand:+ start:324 stop:470 length:147 start_codon:yes stop_codon:yes gene_type:complete
MKQTIYFGVLALILILVLIFARTGSEIINENIPTKSSNVLEKNMKNMI